MNLTLPRFLRHAVAIVSILISGVPALAADIQPPKSWIDPDTGHRVVRLTDEPGSDTFYFNVNAYTPDGKKMAYTTPDGISVLDFEIMEAKALASSSQPDSHIL